jgi:DNA-binding LytR/AlgR family response regulator
MNSQEEPFFYVKSEHRLIKVELSKLLFVECVKDYMRLHVQDQRPIMTLMTLKTIVEYLPRPQFMRIHRSFIVQVSKIDYINKGSVEIAGNNLPISDSYREEFFSYIRKFLLI